MLTLRDRPAHKLVLAGTNTHPRRECVWVPGGDGRDGTLQTMLSKGWRADSGWECDDYAVEEQVRVAGHRSGRVFVVVNLDDDGRGEGVYEVFLADRVVVVDGRETYPDDRCDCPAGKHGVKVCKHRDGIRAVLAAGVYRPAAVEVAG